MNARSQTFINAYGIDLSHAAQPAPAQASSRPQSAAQTRQAVAIDQNRQYRFDAAAKSGARTPPSPAKQPPQPTLASFDTSVIDVGAGWQPMTADATTSRGVARTSEEVSVRRPEAMSTPARSATLPLRPPTSRADFSLEAPSIDEEWESLSYETRAHGSRKNRQPVQSTDAAGVDVQSFAGNGYAVAANDPPVAAAAPASAPAAPSPSVPPERAWQSAALSVEAASPQPAAIPPEPVRPAEARYEPPVQEVPPAPAEPKTSVPPPAEPSQLTPAWEVDRFCWPQDVERLFSSHAEYFGQTGKKLVAASKEGLRVLAVTSSRAGAGSTTLSLCLARAAAAAGAKVGLLDANLQHPDLGQRLGLDFSCGWPAAVGGATALDEAAISSVEEGVTLLPSAPDANDPRSLGDSAFGEMLRKCAASFDLLILDVGQQQLGDNTSVIDAAIVVRDVRGSSEEQTLQRARSLKDGGIKAVGIAENFQSAAQLRAAA